MTQLDEELLLPRRNGCPYLILAPMEGVGDRSFRRAMAAIGGFDEAVRDFLRVPLNAHIKSLARVYDARELGSIPLAAQIMGSEPELMAAMAIELMEQGAPRIDINCGCPSNTVTGRNAGSSLLKDPSMLAQVVQAVVKSVAIPVTVKMRSGYADTSLFTENLLAAQESGVRYITLHPRTKAEGYGPPARIELIAQAKSLLKIPVVGNGDILSVKDALFMLESTRCDALMIGRGSIINPFIFHQIRAFYEQKIYQLDSRDIIKFLDIFVSEMPQEFSHQLRLGKLKQLFGFLFKSSDKLLEQRQSMLRSTLSDPQAFLEYALELLLS